MAKTGRNEPCLCGSGKKYKRCCLAKDEQADRAALMRSHSNRRIASAVPHDHLYRHFSADEYDKLADASDAVRDLIDAGHLDQAEEAAYDLVERFPDAYDGYARLGLLFETRGDHRQAADYYRKVIAFAHQHREFFDPEFSAGYQILIDRLDPPAAGP